MSPPPPRSLLYVPASRPRMLSKMASLDADRFLVDLEDGVVPDEKRSARDRVVDSFSAGGNDRWMLRINATGSVWHTADLEAARAVRAPVVVLPKAESAEAVAELCERAAAWGARVGLMIETVAGVAAVRTLAALDGVCMLIFGSADFLLSTGARSTADRLAERHALAEILLAARLHGRAAIDSAFFHHRDEAGLIAHGTIARAIGFDGKSCIHPCQVAPIHRLFSPNDEEIAWARRVVDAWRERDGERAGLLSVDGEMIESLHVDLARRILEARLTD